MMKKFAELLVTRPGGLPESTAAVETVATPSAVPVPSAAKAKPPAVRDNSPQPSFITPQTFLTYTGATGIISLVVFFLSIAFTKTAGHALGEAATFWITCASAVLVNSFSLLIAYQADGVKKPTGWGWVIAIGLALLNTLQMTLAVVSGTHLANSAK